MKNIIQKLNGIWTASIQRQLMLGIILVHAALMTIFVYDLVTRQQNFLHSQSISQAHSLANTLAANSVSWVLSNDVVGLEEIVQSQINYPDLEYAMVLSPKGRVLAHTDEMKIGLYTNDSVSRKLLSQKKQKYLLVNSTKIIDVASPIFSNGKFIGWARVSLGQEKIISGLNIITRNGMIYTFLAILVGSLFAYFMARGITKGLKHLVYVADGIQDGNLNLRSTLSRKDELGQLSDDFNLMLEAINKGKRDLQTLIENSPALIYAKDLDGRYIFINNKWEQLFAKNIDGGVIGKTDYDIFEKDIAKGFVRNDQAVIKAKHAINSEETAPLEDGIHTYVSIKFPLFDDNKDIYAICGISTDITERKKLDENLLASEQHLNLYREQSPLASIEWDTDFRVKYWNNAAEQIFGYTFEEVKGRNPLEFLIPNEIKTNIEDVWNALINQKGGTTSINENITKDGQHVLCEWHNTALIDEAGNVIGAASIGQDITKRQRKEEQLRRSQKMEALGKLTGGIAHDYNNMLGVILGYAELLSQRLSEQPELEKYAKEIHRSGTRGANLTKKLLSFSQQKENEATVENINTLIEKQHLMLEKSLTARIKLILELDNDLWPVLIDGNDLEDTILNMCINAMHAIDGNGKITITTENKNIKSINAKLLNLTPGDYVLLSVIDTGCGMDDTIIEKIFDPFFTTKGEFGSGLGLSQVYGFVERSKGVVKVYSEKNHGSRFTFYFPRFVGTDHVAPSNITTKVNKNNLTGTETILIVDDEPSLLKLTSEILSQHGYRVLKTEISREVLEILDKEHVDLLVSDIIMPDMDGATLASLVQEKYPFVKIQLASGYSEHHINSLDPDLYANLLHKPYNSHDLLIRIRELLDN